MSPFLQTGMLKTPTTTSCETECEVKTVSVRNQRHQRLLLELSRAERPLTGGELAARCDVTRQVVVHDIAIIRASGVDIVSTPRGYWLQRGNPGRNTTVLSVCHSPDLTELELTTLVDYGIEVVDVTVEHPLYGELRGGLRLASRRDVELFLRQVKQSDVMLLSSLTDGFHLHTVVFPHKERLNEAIAALKQRGIQVFGSDDDDDGDSGESTPGEYPHNSHGEDSHGKDSHGGDSLGEDPH